MKTAELTFRRAEAGDLDEIALLVGAAIQRLTERRIFQWDEDYPTKDDFSRDIQRRELYAGTIGGKIAVVYALNRECDAQYANGAWQYTGEAYRILHRLCVSPDFWNKGVARTTLRHIEADAARQGAQAIRLDAFLENPAALRLYSKSGYRTTGIACWRKSLFILLEKVLTAEHPCPRQALRRGFWREGKPSTSEAGRLAEIARTCSQFPGCAVAPYLPPNLPPLPSTAWGDAPRPHSG